MQWFVVASYSKSATPMNQCQGACWTQIGKQRHREDILELTLRCTMNMAQDSDSLSPVFCSFMSDLPTSCVISSLRSSRWSAANSHQVLPWWPWLVFGGNPRWEQTFLSLADFRGSNLLLKCCREVILICTNQHGYVYMNRSRLMLTNTDLANQH